jgi:zinc protease
MSARAGSFLEHMCFNGSEHFPDNSIDRHFEIIGANDGVKAYTSIEETGFCLSFRSRHRQLGIILSFLLVITTTLPFVPS